ncbi:MAG: twin-arginine translocase TatA/TatE family subunit, partial [Actinomycetota bacterium]|nr:twin-arginine translocase TatA/TatE family subunit [Actinomycetota bacterium]
ASQVPDGSPALLMSVGLLEILLVFIAFLVLGPRRIADLLRSLGRGVYDFVEALGRDKNNELPEDEREVERKPRG